MSIQLSGRWMNGCQLRWSCFAFFSQKIKKVKNMSWHTQKRWSRKIVANSSASSSAHSFSWQLKSFPVFFHCHVGGSQRNTLLYSLLIVFVQRFFSYRSQPGCGRWMGEACWQAHPPPSYLKSKYSRCGESAERNGKSLRAKANSIRREYFSGWFAPQAQHLVSEPSYANMRANLSQTSLAKKLRERWLICKQIRKAFSSTTTFWGTKGSEHRVCLHCWEMFWIRIKGAGVNKQPTLFDAKIITSRKVAQRSEFREED